MPRTGDASPVDIDVCVWAATHLKGEAGHEVARALIDAVVRLGVRIEQPSITLVELASALRRRGIERDEVARRIGWLTAFEGCTFHDLDGRAAIAAAGAAIVTGLRAGDAVYLATARHTGAILITFDQELLAAKMPGVRVMTPEAWLAAYGAA